MDAQRVTCVNLSMDLLHAGHCLVKIHRGKVHECPNYFNLSASRIIMLQTEVPRKAEWY